MKNANLGELAVARIAGIGSISSMSPHMSLKVAWPQEWPLTLAALIRWQEAPVVSSEVHTQVTSSGKRDAADITAVALLLRATTTLRCWFRRFLSWLCCHQNLRVHLWHHFRCLNLHLRIHQVFVLYNLFCNGSRYQNKFNNESV